MNDGSDRQVVILDVGDLLPEARGQALPAPAGRSAANLPTDLQRVAAFVRQFAAPLGEPGADLQPLGDRHLVVLGSPVQVAAAERLLAHSRTTIAKEYLVDVRLCDVPAAVFDAHCAPLLAAADGLAATADRANRTCVLDAAATTALRRALEKGGHVKVTQFPKIVSPSLRLAKLMVGKRVSYVRDFEVEVADGATVADPVVDVLWNGHDVEVLCAETGKGKISAQVTLVDQVVEEPLREVTTTIPGTTREVTVQVPRVIGCRGSQAVEVANGATAVMAARKGSGSWLVSLLTFEEITSPVPFGNVPR